jgi:hypothetical protein
LSAGPAALTVLSNRIARPSGRHRGLDAARSALVRRFGSPPDASTTYTWSTPSPVRFALNAIRLESGDQEAPPSLSGVDVRRRGAPPSGETSHRSLIVFAGS